MQKSIIWKAVLAFSFLFLFFFTPLCRAELVGFWSFDKADITENKVIDQSGKGNDGEMGNVTPTAGKIGQALKFNGLNSYVYINNLVVSGKELSVSLWINRGLMGGVRRLIYFDGLLQFGFYEGDIFVHTTTLNGDDTNLPYFESKTKPGQWYHLAVTWDTAAPADNIKVYIDGDLKSKATLIKAKGGELGTAGLKIGNTGVLDEDSPAPSPVFDGVVDEVAVYNNALTAQEVKCLYEKGN